MTPTGGAILGGLRKINECRICFTHKENQKNRENSRLANFRNKIVGGLTYDLSHLDQFLLSLEIDMSTYAVEIAFSSHCFTEKLQPHHAPDLRYTHDGEQRTFNVARYELSKSLPGMFQALGIRTVYRSERQDYFVFQDVAISSEKIPYITFFNVIRSTKKGVNVRLNVTSAYLKPGMSLHASPVKFTTLIASAATGKPLNAGPKKHIKRKQAPKDLSLESKPRTGPPCASQRTDLRRCDCRIARRLTCS